METPTPLIIRDLDGQGYESEYDTQGSEGS